MKWFGKSRYDELQSILDSIPVFNGTKTSPADQRVVYDLDGLKTTSGLGIVIALKDCNFTFCLKVEGDELVVHSAEHGLRPIRFPWRDIDKKSLGLLLSN